MAFFHVIIKHQHELFTTVRLIRANVREIPWLRNTFDIDFLKIV